MATLLSSIESQVRSTNLIETVAKYWSSDELIAIVNRGIKDLWRDIVDLKQEHFITIDSTNVSLSSNSSTLTGVPVDVHKVYQIELRDLSENGTNQGLIFTPLEYTHRDFQAARASAPIDPSGAVIYYALHKQGAPVSAPEVRVAPQVTSSVNLSFAYIPTLTTLLASGTVPIPGEADNALIAWTTAFARAKEREDRSPDPGWLAIYATEKQHLLQSLGQREYQENDFAGAVFEDYW